MPTGTGDALRRLDNSQLFADEQHRQAMKPGLVLNSVSDLRYGDIVTAIKGVTVIQGVWRGSLTLDGHTFDLSLMEHTGWTLSYRRDAMLNGDTKKNEEEND